MKKLFLNLMAAVVSLTSAAELRNDAFIIRTTDGAAQGFLFGDVEKITFSNLDNEGIPHTDVFYQELHFPDTIIRTPVTEITGVTFDKPVAKFQPNVVQYYESGLEDFVYKIEDMVFYFRRNIPESLTPKEGNVLVSFDPSKELGVFAYRVKEVRNTSSSIEVECVKASRIQDVYAELRGVEAVTEDTPGVYEALRKAGALRTDNKIRKVSGGGKSTIPFDINIDYNLYGGDDDDDDDDEDDGGDNKSFHITGGVKGELELRIAYDFSKERDFLSVGTTYEYTPYFSFNIQSEAKWERKAFDPLRLPFLTITPPACPIFSVTLGAAPFFRALGTARVSIDRTFPTTRSRTLAIYHNGEYMSRSANVNADADDPNNTGGFSANFSLEGSLMVGADVKLYVGTTRVLDTSIGIVAEALVGPKISGSIGGSITNMPTFKDGPNTMLHNLIKDWNVSASWCSVELGVSYYQQILGGKEEEVSLFNMSFDTDPWSATMVPDFDEIGVELVRRSQIREDGIPLEGDPLTSQWSYLKFTVSQPEGTWLLDVKPGWAIYEDDKFLKSQHTINTHPCDVNWEEVYGDLEWSGFTDFYPNRTYTVYPVYLSWLSSEVARVDTPVTFKYPATVTTGPDSYKWLNKDVVECSFSCHSDLEPFVLNPYFYGRGVVVSQRPIIVENGIMIYDKSDKEDTFEFVYENRAEGADYANAYTAKASWLEKGKNYYYCAAVKMGSRDGSPIYYCGDVSKFYVPMYPDSPDE